MSHAIHKIVSIKRCQSYFISRRSPHLGISKDSELCASAHRCLHYAYARLIARVTFHLLQYHFIQMPDLIHILLDGSVGGKLARASHVQDRALSPVVFVAVSGFYSLLCLCVGLEVLEDEVGVCLGRTLGVQQRIVQRAEQLGISGAKVPLISCISTLRTS